MSNLPRARPADRPTGRCGARALFHFIPAKAISPRVYVWILTARRERLDSLTYAALYVWDYTDRPLRSSSEQPEGRIQLHRAAPCRAERRVALAWKLAGASWSICGLRYRAEVISEFMTCRRETSSALPASCHDNAHPVPETRPRASEHIHLAVSLAATSIIK